MRGEEEEEEEREMSTPPRVRVELCSSSSDRSKKNKKLVLDVPSSCKTVKDFIETKLASIFSNRRRKDMTTKKSGGLRLSLDGGYELLESSPMNILRDDERIIARYGEESSSSSEEEEEEELDTKTKKEEKFRSRSAERKANKRRMKREEKRVRVEGKGDGGGSGGTVPKKKRRIELDRSNIISAGRSAGGGRSSGSSSSSSSSSSSGAREREAKVKSITEGGFPDEKRKCKEKEKQEEEEEETERYAIKAFEKLRAQKRFGSNNALVDWPKNEKEWRKVKKMKPHDYVIHNEKIEEQFSIEENGKLAEDDPLAAWMHIFRCDENVDDMLAKEELEEKKAKLLGEDRKTMQRAKRVKDISNVLRSDILAYKTLTINETDGTPEVSKWLRGSVQYVDVKNKTIRLRPNPEDRAISAGQLWFEKNLPAPPPYQSNGLLELSFDDFAEIVCIGGRSIWNQLDATAVFRDVPKELRNGAGLIPPSALGVPRGHAPTRTQEQAGREDDLQQQQQQQQQLEWCANDKCAGKELHLKRDCLEGLSAEELEARGMILLHDEENAAHGGYRYFVRPENAFGKILKDHQARYLVETIESDPRAETEVRQEAEDTIERLNALNKAIGPMRPLSHLSRDWRVNPNAQAPLPSWCKGEAVPLASDAIVPASEVEEKEEEKETRATPAPSVAPPRSNSNNNINNNKKKKKKKFSNKSGGVGAALSRFRDVGAL